MKLNGWSRLLIVISITWVIITATRSYAEYPTTGSFGGIPLGQFTFWSVVETPFDQTDERGYLVSSYHIEPKLVGFILHGGLPIAILWLAYVAIPWIWRGFQAPKVVLPVDPERPIFHDEKSNSSQGNCALGTLGSPNSPHVALAALLLMLRIVRAILGAIGSWQIVGLLPALSLLGNQEASAQIDAIILMKSLLVFLCFGFFFAMRFVINSIYSRRYGTLHPALVRKWSL